MPGTIPIASIVADSAEATGLKWAAASSGAVVFINRTTFSGSTTVNIDSLFSNTYENYLIRVQNYGSADNVPTQFRGRYSGSTYSGSQYNFAYLGCNYAGAGANSYRGNGITEFNLPSNNQDTSTPKPLNAFDINLYRDSSSNYLYYSLTGNAYYGGIAWSGGGVVASSQTWTGLSFFASSGTITGQVSVYGMVKS